MNTYTYDGLGIIMKDGEVIARLDREHTEMQRIIAVLNLIEDARGISEQGDPHLAAYYVRDLPETEAANLSDLAWSMTKEYPHKNDATYLLDELEAHILKGG